MNKYVNGVLVEMTDAEIAEFNASLPTDAERLAESWLQVRNYRNRLLLETDWVAARASETGVAVSDDWKTYRQALRDVPTQSDPNNITWPTKPS
tara:strand:+ start:12345 stop:12626 length:282 start_codon:yes stop_codon:yes gene_type:complete